jgi:RNA recognition motif-containing protein
MTTKIYVDNLAAATTENELKVLFSAYGNVADVSIAVDRTNQKPRGFGFVTMVTPEGARSAILALHGKQVATHTLIVNEAWPCEECAGSPRERRNARRSPVSLARSPLKGAS